MAIGAPKNSGRVSPTISLDAEMRAERCVAR